MTQAVAQQTNPVFRMLDSAEQFGHALPLEYSEDLFYTLVSVIAYAAENHPNMTIEQLLEKDACARMLVKAHQAKVIQ